MMRFSYMRITHITFLPIQFYKFVGSNFTFLYQHSLSSMTLTRMSYPPFLRIQEKLLLKLRKALAMVSTSGFKIGLSSRFRMKAILNPDYTF